jgi:protease-4
MDQQDQYSNPGSYYPGGNPPPPPPGSWTPPPQPRPAGQPVGPQAMPRPQVVHVVARPGGFWRAVTFIIGLMMFGIVLTIGIFLGMSIMIAGAEREDMVIHQTYRDGDGNTIAIVPVIGGIDERQAEFVRMAVKSVLEDSSVRAVVLRVDSPGGGVTASDQIWYEVQRMKDAGLPVIASYGSVAASGGYYVSCGADHIMAEETCITGSIGVIAQILTLEGLMDKVGVKPVTLVAHGSPQKNVANDMFRTWTEEDRAKIITMLDSAYVTFNKRVADGRAKVITDKSKLDALANGSIYTAKQALDGGLIDGIGYLDDAIAHAEKAGGIPTDSATVIMLRKAPTLFGDGLLAQSRGPGNSLNAEAVRTWVNELSAPRMMYLMH